MRLTGTTEFLSEYARGNIKRHLASTNGGGNSITVLEIGGNSLNLKLV